MLILFSADKVIAVPVSLSCRTLILKPIYK